MIDKERLILTDIDGVCLDWNTGFDIFMKDNGYSRIPDTDHHYNLAYRYNVKDWKCVNKLVTDYNESPLMKYLDPLPGAVETIHKLANDGFRFTAITSISDKPTAKIYRQENLTEVFGDVFDELVCLPVGHAKQKALEPWANSGLFWLEDHFINAEAGFEMGLSSILFDTTYNRNLQTDLFPRTSEDAPWDDVYALITQAYGLQKAA